MSTTAYCVVHLDTTVHPPRFIVAEIYNVGAWGILGAIRPGRFALDVGRADGVDYADAAQKLRWRLRADPVFAWVVDLLPERLEAERGFVKGDRVHGRFSGAPGTVLSVEPAGPRVLFDGDDEAQIVHTNHLRFEPNATAAAQATGAAVSDLLARIREWRQSSGLPPEPSHPMIAEIALALTTPHAHSIRSEIRWTIGGTHEHSCFLCNAGWWDEGGPEDELHVEGCIAAPAGCRLIAASQRRS